jgi:F-box associated protein
MTAISPNSCPILRLPQELLLEILQLTRPDDFEAFMMTCKTIYQVGAPLIEEHNFCKTWRVPDDSGYLKGLHIRMSGSFTFFLHFLGLPSSTQNNVLQYWMKVNWRGGFYPEPEGMTESAVLQKVSLEAPWLLQQIQAINKDLQCLKLCYDEVIFDAEFEFEDSPIENAWPGITNSSRALSLFPDLIVLLLLPNLRSLKIEGYVNKGILGLIHHQNGERYFQQLRKVYIKDHNPKSLIQIAPLLLLPNLKSLVIWGLEDREPRADGREAIVFEWPYGNKKSVLENICFYQAGAEALSLYNFLSPCLSLRSFVWENLGLVDNEDFGSLGDSPSVELPDDEAPGDEAQGEDVENLEAHNDELRGEEATNVQAHSDGLQGEEVQGEKYSTPEDTFKDESIIGEDGTNVEYANLDKCADDKEDSQSTPDDGGYYPTNSPIFWKPEKLLREVLLPHKDTLEHIALSMVVNIGLDTIIKRPDHVHHFKDFPNLKYLEFDERVVMPRNWEVHFNTRHGISASLVTILPSSIEHARMWVFEPEFENVCGMLQDLPSQKANFPHLQTICLVLRVATSMYGESDPDEWVKFEETKKRLVLLQDDLRNVGVKLAFEGIEFEQFQPRASDIFYENRAVQDWWY